MTVHRKKIRDIPTPTVAPQRGEGSVDGINGKQTSLDGINGEGSGSFYEAILEEGSYVGSGLALDAAYMGLETNPNKSELGLRKLFLGTATKEERRKILARFSSLMFYHERAEAARREKASQDLRHTKLESRWLEYKIIYRNMGDRAGWNWTRDEFVKFHRETLVCAPFTHWKNDFQTLIPRVPRRGEKPLTYKLVTLEELLKAKLRVIIKPIDRSKGFAIGNLEVSVGCEVVYSDRPIPPPVKMRKKDRWDTNLLSGKYTQMSLYHGVFKGPRPLDALLGC